VLFAVNISFLRFKNSRLNNDKNDLSTTTAEWKNENIVKHATWNVRSVICKEEQLHTISDVRWKIIRNIFHNIFLENFLEHFPYGKIFYGKFSSSHH
jgi:hypothetical protein